MCVVGQHLGSKWVLWMDWWIIAMSIAVLLSSNTPPLPRDVKWSYKDHQRPTIRDSMSDLRARTSLAASRSKGPSRHSANISNIHSHTPDAVKKACASPDMVEATILGKRYDFQAKQWTGTSAPWRILSEVKLLSQPPCLFSSVLFAKASDQKHTVSSWRVIYGTWIFKSDCWRARRTAWLTWIKSWTVGAGKHCWLMEVCTARSGLDRVLIQLTAPFTALKAEISCGVARSHGFMARSLEILTSLMCSAYSFCWKWISCVSKSWQ